MAEKIQLKLHLMFQKLAGKKGISFKYFSDNWESEVKGKIFFLNEEAVDNISPASYCLEDLKIVSKLSSSAKHCGVLTAKVLMQDKNRTLPHLKIRSVSWMGLAPLCMSVSTQAYTSWQFSGFPYMDVWPTYSDQIHTQAQIQMRTQERNCPFKLRSYVNSHILYVSVRLHAGFSWVYGAFNTFFSACFNIPSVNMWWKPFRCKWCLINSYWQNRDFWTSPRAGP